MDRCQFCCPFCNLSEFLWNIFTYSLLNNWITTMVMKCSTWKRTWHREIGRWPNISDITYIRRLFIPLYLFLMTRMFIWLQYIYNANKDIKLTQLATFQTILGQRLVAWMTSSSYLNLYEAVKTWLQLLCQQTSGTCTWSLLDKVI